MGRRRIAAIATGLTLLASLAYSAPTPPPGPPRPTPVLTAQQQAWDARLRPLRRWRVDRSRWFGREHLPELNRPVQPDIQRGAWPEMPAPSPTPMGLGL